MNKKELDTLEQRVLEELKRREKLGPYDVNAEPILFLTKCVAILVQHLNRKPAKNRKRKK